MFEPPPHLLLCVEHSVLAPAAARSCLRTHDPEAAQHPRFPDVLLATSELVSNAVQHSTGTIVMTAWCDPDALWRVEVEDESHVIPRLGAESSPASAGGRGLRIIDAIASSWGVVPTASGKRCWFELQT